MERKTERKTGWVTRGRLTGVTVAVIAVTLYTILTLVYLRPVWQVWQDHIAPVPEDPVFNLYVLKWGVHQIRLGLPHFWDANVLYPLRGTLALSDHLLGPAAQLALFETLIPNAVAGYNFLFVTSFVASALATAWVVRRSGSSVFAALLAGWMFAFSPFRLQHFNHLQILLAQWIPLTLWSWDRLLAERTPGNAIRFFVFYLLHVTGGCYLAYMIHVPLLVLLLNRAAVHGRALLEPRSLRLLAPVVLAAGVVLAVLFLPYVETSRRLGLARSEVEFGAFGATAASYVSPAPRNLYYGQPSKAFFRDEFGDLAEPFFRTENALFAGFLPTLLAIWGIADWMRRRPHPPDPPLPSPSLPPGEGGNRLRWIALTALLVTALAAVAWGDLLTLTRPELQEDLPFRLGAWGWDAPGLLLAISLGLWLFLRLRWRGPFFPSGTDPWLRGIALSGVVCCALTFPIVYAPLARIVPGLDGMRVAARFYAFVSLAVVLFAARGTDRLLERLRSARVRRGVTVALAVVLIMGLAVELAPKEVHWVPLLREEEFPPVYSWIAHQPDVRALLELPIRRNWRENVAMYYSTRHWKPIANGYSGYEPWPHQAIAESIHHYPDRRAVELLRQMGITHILIHIGEVGRRGLLGAAALADFERALATGPERELEPVYRDDDEDVRVYRILRAPAVPRTG